MAQSLKHRCAVIGDPIAHSLSPVIHRAFAQQQGIDLSYEKIHVRAAEFDAHIHDLAHTYDGINITVPHKTKAWAFAEQNGTIDRSAQKSGAVNTLKFTPNIVGFNTDGDGLVHDLTTRLAFPITDQTILILGAGGAARGILGALLQKKPKKVVLANRTLSNAEKVGALFGLCGNRFSDIKPQSFDIVINATSASLDGAVPDLPQAIFSTHTLAYDLMYAKQRTPFEQWAISCQAGVVCDGLGMLVEQAALAFYLWTQVRPSTSPIFDSLNLERNRS